MACIVKITQVIGAGLPAQPATSIKVNGAATGCPIDVVTVTLNCPAGSVTANANVDAAGNWEHEFVGIDKLNCVCNGTFSVQASINTPLGVFKDTWSGNLECSSSDCPTVSLSLTVSTGCTGDIPPKRTVALTADFVNVTQLSVAQFEFGDGSGFGMAHLIDPANPATFTYTESHDYLPPGPYTATLHFILPSGCAPSVIQVGPLAPCEMPDCPEITGVKVTVGGGCLGPGSKVDVKFEVALAPSGFDCDYVWDFGDGKPNVTTNNPTITYTYEWPVPIGVSKDANGNYDFDVSLALQCGDCALKSKSCSAVIPPCCAVVTTVQGIVGMGCADKDLGKTLVVVFTASTSPPNAPGFFEWDFGDGVTASTNGPTVSHVYETPGTKDVSVKFTPSDPTCSAQVSFAETTVYIPACPDEPTNGDGEDEEEPDENGNGGCGCCLCQLLFLIAVLALMGAFFLIVIALCPVNPWLIALSIVLFLIALIAFGLWLGFCVDSSSCSLLNSLIEALEWMLLVLVPILAVIIAIFGGPFCALGTILGGAYLGIFLALANKIAKEKGCLIEKN